MTFNLVRMGWPNIAAILALAIMPVVALTTAPEPRSAALQLEQIEPAATCLTLAGCSMTIAAAAPETILE
jgi:hypothetical protein